MPYDAKVVANYFLELARRDGVPLTPLKLQKLVYLAHGWSLALRGQPLISQHAEAWRYGPVIPELYQAFKKFGGSPITERARVGENATELDEESKGLIASVWRRYKNLSAVQLSALTHEPGSAWYLSMRDSGPFGSSVIPDSLISDEFERRRNRQA
jgi:uncharacterized phage-associated protein